jgi:hypothetical protein
VYRISDHQTGMRSEGLSCIMEKEKMVSQKEVRESHELFGAAWALYPHGSGGGEVVEREGVRIANARSPWFLLNAALLAGPVSSPADLAARARAASEYFGRDRRQWFFAGSQQWLGTRSAETLAELGFAGLVA